MESVEELCEYITLLHESEKILDGKLDDIKRAYKRNIFNVGITVHDHTASSLKTLESQFAILSSSYDDQHKQLNLQLQLPNDDTKSVLHLLTTKGNINHFEEMIPSANDIFIQTVKSKDK
jgi:ABC-2 type transport system ATP-binding protein